MYIRSGSETEKDDERSRKSFRDFDLSKNLGNMNKQDDKEEES